MTRISLITPCFNAASYIKETVLSVINQTALLRGNAELEYIICDGGSTDDTVAIIESIGSASIKLTCERDRGLYDALAKGLNLATGDITAYINAGDYYHHTAFDIVLELILAQKADWLTGCNVAYNDASQVIGLTLPYAYRSRHFALGYYNGDLLPCVQQESTFWNSRLNALIDLATLRSFKLAGDYYLWHEFSRKHELKIVYAYLGGFKYHSQQLSLNKQAYQAELARIVKGKPRARDYLQARIDRVIWGRASNEMKLRLNPRGIISFNRNISKWT